MEILRKKLILEASKKVVENFDREALVVQTSRFLQELDKDIKQFRLRLKTWYQYYNHEIEDVLDFKGEKSFLGASLKNKDLAILGSNVEGLRNIIFLRENNFNYLTLLMEEIAPTLVKVAGVGLGARFIDFAGGLKKLALLASSQVQLLGAEKALFRHLKTGGNPPKYGIIYFHPEVQKAQDKGKAARKLAVIISQAARTDGLGQ